MPREKNQSLKLHLLSVTTRTKQEQEIVCWGFGTKNISSPLFKILVKVATMSFVQYIYLIKNKDKHSTWKQKGKERVPHWILAHVLQTVSPW